jgi:hypothetical protein
MAFGQASGPPASAGQLRELMELLNSAGHEDFRDARGPMQLTQRQAAGKFTRTEADELIARLQAAADGIVDEPARPAPRRSRTEQLLRDIPAEQLAGELQRRGWLVVEP